MTTVEGALTKIGAEVVRVEEKPTRIVYTVRVKVDDDLVAARWRSTIESFILGTKEIQDKEMTRPEEKRTHWQSDVSKFFFAHQGGVRFLWRIMIMSPRAELIERGQNMLAMSAMRALSEGAEVTSFPLVGRKHYELDPTQGKFKGAHNSKMASRLIAAAIGGTNNGGTT